MAAVMKSISDFVSWADSKSDERTRGWLLMSNPAHTCLCVVLYLLVVWRGPIFMSTRKALNLKYVMMAYNLSMVLLNAYMFYEFFASSFLNPNFNLACQQVDYSNDPQAVRLANVCWWFFFSKVLELMDTVIFILRKKNNQISFLHVYHHATMPALWWIGVRWVAGGASYFSAIVNCSIHVFMYSYYFLSALGPEIQPYLWWKKYLTSLQLIQFFMVITHAVVATYTACGFPTVYIYALITYLISHIILFSNFFHKTYVKEKAGGVSSQHVNGSEASQRNNPYGRYNLRERPPKTPKGVY